MKTGKIKEVHQCKDYTSQHGLMYYMNLTLDNGDEINIGKKKKMEVGEEVNYELTGTDDGQQRFKKAKAVQPMQQGKGGFIPKDQDAIIYQTCLKCASEILSVRGNLQVEIKASEVSEYAFTLAKESKANIEKLKSI